jgi:hypothetical protein
MARKSPSRLNFLNAFAGLCLKSFAVFALAFLCTARASAAGLPKSEIPDSLGLSIHDFSKMDEDLPRVRAAGFRNVRMDLRWNKVEAKRGNFDFGSYDSIAKALRSNGLRPIFILGYSNNLYLNGGATSAQSNADSSKTPAPTSAVGQTAFVRFVAAAVSRYKDEKPIWEMWNEPDAAGSWQPQPNVEQYLALATVACQKIRQLDPDATIIAPAASKVPSAQDPQPSFLKAVILSTLANCIDGVSIHPYLHIRDLDTTPDMWRQVRSMIIQNPGAASKLVPVSSEWGLSTYRAGITDETQAAYLVKEVLLNVAAGIPISVIYDWRDDGSDPKNPEYRYGITRQNGQPKPAYFALQYMAQRLSSSRFICRKEGANFIGLLFRQIDATPIFVVWPRPGILEWAASTNGELDLSNIPRPAVVTDMLGHTVGAQIQNGGFAIRSGMQPFYLTFTPGASSGLSCK